MYLSAARSQCYHTGWIINKCLFFNNLDCEKLILWDFDNSKYLCSSSERLYKRIIILVSFLAYSLTLVHSLVPHHHQNEAKADHHHQHQNSDKDHHHPEQHGDDKSLSHIFADAIHHPASELVIQNPESQRIQKGSNAVDLFIAEIGETILLRIRPPDPLTNYQENHYSSQQDSFFLLRAPPVA
jgi:hypothetical protein